MKVRKGHFRQREQPKPRGRSEAILSGTWNINFILLYQNIEKLLVLEVSDTI